MVCVRIPLLKSGHNVESGDQCINIDFIYFRIRLLLSLYYGADSFTCWLYILHNCIILIIGHENKMFFAVMK